MAESEKVAVITGATGALGRVVTKDLLEKGFVVVAPFRKEATKKELLDHVGALGSRLKMIQAEVSVEEDVNRLFSEVSSTYGKIDVLLNLAGGYKGGQEVQNTPVEIWDSLLEMNLKTTILCCRAALPMMISRNSGRILNVGARTGMEKRYRAKSAAYAVAKAGVAVLTEALAEELKKTDITVNAILPSTIDTPMNHHDMPQADSSKWVKPEDVSKVIQFLISDDSKATSGALIPVYGRA